MDLDGRIWSIDSMTTEKHLEKFAEDCCVFILYKFLASILNTIFREQYG